MAPSTPKPCVSAKAACAPRLAERLASELTPLPGVREALDALAGYPRAVVSNGPESKIRTGLTTTGLSDYFGDRLISGYTVQCWKPDPCLYLHAASLMGYEARECIAIDDAIVGVKAALAAGWLEFGPPPQSRNWRVEARTTRAFDSAAASMR